MEVIDEKQIPEQRGRKKREDTTLAGRIYLGAILIVTGLFWLFRNMDIISYTTFGTLFSWQMLLVVVGGYLLVVRRWISGVIVGGLGVLFLFFDVFGVNLSFSSIILPILIMATGVALIVSRFDNR